MSNDNSLVPSGNSPGTLQPNLTSINREAVANIQEIFANEQLPRKVRRDMIRQEFTRLIEKRDVQLDAALRIETRRVAGIERVAVEQIKRQEEEFVLQIHQELVGVLGTLGVELKMNSLKCVKDFSKQIHDFRREVERENIEPELREHFIQMAKDAFHNLAKQLGEIAGSEAEKIMNESP